VDTIRGNTSKTVFYSKILNEYISKKPEDNHSKNQISNLVNEFEKLNQLLKPKPHKWWQFWN
jgi:hypothetical protein